MTQTRFGTLFVGTPTEIYERLALQILETNRLADGEALVALTGGSSPKTFYRWAVENECFAPDAIDAIRWTTSDERWVPLESEDSNFGHASRLLLDPLGIDSARRTPWVTTGDPASSAREMDAYLRGRTRDEIAIDLCILGMGDDAHTASIFPGSPILDPATAPEGLCISIDTPTKGQRLTYTPRAFASSGLIVVHIQGAAKAETVRSVFLDDHETREQPIRVLAEQSNRVLWLLDHEAARLL